MEDENKPVTFALLKKELSDLRKSLEFRIDEIEKQLPRKPPGPGDGPLAEIIARLANLERDLTQVKVMGNELSESIENIFREVNNLKRKVASQRGNSSANSETMFAGE